MMLKIGYQKFPANTKKTSEYSTNIYTTQKKQQIHIDKICFIIYYYSPTRFGRFYNHHQELQKQTSYSLYSLVLQCTDLEHRTLNKQQLRNTFHFSVYRTPFK